MRNMTTTSTSATMGKERDTDMLVKVDHERPSTTTASASATATSKSQTKNAFRFPRFSLRSPSMSSHATAQTVPIKTTRHHHHQQQRQGVVATAASSPHNSSSSSTHMTPRTYRRLRSFPLLRIRTNQDTSETSAMTSEAPQGVQSTSSSSNSSTSTSSATSSSPRRESREDFVMRCTKIVAVQNSPGEQQQQQQQQEEFVGQQAPSQQQQRPQEEPSLPQSPSSMDLQQQQQQQEEGQMMSTFLQRENSAANLLPGYSCATAILQHSYLEMVCGRHSNALVVEPPQDGLCGSPQPPSSFSQRRIPDDPTVQDSIECVFASQLEEGLPLWVEEDEEDEDDDQEEHRDEQEQLQGTQSYEEEPINAPSEAELPSPAPLMQSRQKSRTPLPAVTKALIPSKRRSHPSNNMRFPLGPKKQHSSSSSSTSTARRRRRKKYQTAKMVHVGTFDPRTNRILEVAETDHNLMEEDPAVRVTSCSIQSPPRKTGTCYCHSQSCPVVPQEYWPQAPLLLRPTPGEGITVLGIRKSGQSNHFWTPADGGWWLTPLYELAGKEAPSLPPGVPSMCPQCCLLPINNGNEPVGEALVTDFETPLFEGTLLVRLRHVDGGATTTHSGALDYKDDIGYFAGLNRRYQVVIRGKFKQEIPLTDMVAGCVMDRPVGRLPPKWIMKGAVKVLSFFAPQLEVQMDCPRPKTVAPLGSTPQALVVQEIGPHDETLPPLDATVEEPKTAKESVLGQTFSGNTSLQRARARKKAFDKLYTANSKHPRTKTSSGSKETYYTFEFLQHLVNFQDFSVELGNLLGSIPIAPILSGQPIPIMAMMHKGEQKVWSFDIWHRNLVEGAKKHDARKQA